MQFNSLQKYRNSLLVYFGVNVVIASLVLYGVIVVPESGIYDSTPLIPLKNQFYEIFFVVLIIPLSSTLGALFGGYMLAPLYLLAHKTFYRKMIYGIQEIAPADGFKRALRGYYPALMAFNLGFIILYSVPNIMNRILTPIMIDLVPISFLYIAGNLFLMMFTIGLSMLVFSPGWFLIDAGIVCSTREHVRGKGRPVEGRAVGGWFNDYLRGYSGFGVAFSYLQILVVYFNEVISQGLTISPADVIGWFGFPVYVIIMVIPSLILLDLIQEHRTRYIRRVAARMGITKVVKIYFD